MIAPLLAALTLAVASEPCAPVEPLPQPDPASAALYREVGDSEQAAGHREPALAAYRDALRNDPSDTKARAALDRLCRAPAGADPFQEGLRRMQAGQPREAIAQFEQARAGGPDPSAALLEGICWYNLGDDDAAAPLLREAELRPEHREMASYYRGLVALREGSASDAARLFDVASADPALEHLSAGLARVAHRDGRLVLSIVAESGWDSNVSLAPGGTFGPTSASDGTYGLSATALYRILGPSGPYLRASGFLHDQFQLGTYDLKGVDGAVGWQVGRADRGALAEYDLGYRTFGMNPFLTSHQLLGSGWLGAGGVVWTASWLGRFESYDGGFSPFSGFLQHGELRATFPLGDRALAGLAYGLGHDSTERSVLDFTEHGPGALLRLGVTPRLRFGLDAALTFREYGAFDPTLSARRADQYLDGAVFTEYDLSNHLMARVALTGRKAFSNVDAFDYAKLVPTVGLAWIGGW
ncbi:MAG TPA: tetratricopeptide repeat protein [Anaeromyxobacteraceae bacterium]|nr:tetratricopeptide repeat protein [Anaeromyxobacteraceae bacterium]